MKDGKMTAKEIEIFNYVKENGGRVSVTEICDAIGRDARSISPNVNALVKEENGALLAREKVEVEGAEKPVTYIVLTEAGKHFVQAD